MTIPTISDIRRLEGTGPWKTKSGGDLNVLFGIPLKDILHSYFQYDHDELSKISTDIRGLRSYKVSSIKSGQIGANEWHRIRQELVFCLEGQFTWTCEDLVGHKQTYDLRPGIGYWVPPYILHSYCSEKDGGHLIIVANTLFDPDNPDTHDIYSIEEFKKLQTDHKNDS